MLDIHTAGAGGGSLAWMDTAGALQVGPQSAGADPGPACYGRGDQSTILRNRATVTDANLILGRLHPDHFLGGAMHLDGDRARRALSAIPTKSFASLEHLAEGILRVANARMESALRRGMESALRRVSVERGHDPRNFTLLAFGGAGPLHACALAQSLGIRRVLIPAAPGALSALGILDADLRREFSRTVMLVPNSAHIAKVFRELETEARAAFASGHPSPVLRRSADLRYHGQGYELRVDWSANAVTRFHQLHARSYGYADPARPVEIVTLRVQAIARSEKPGAPSGTLRVAQFHRAMDGKPTKAGSGQAPISPHRIFEEGRWRSAALYDRARLQSGNRISGPAVITELSATTYLPTSWIAAVDALSNLVLTPISGGRR
jgi:N-methylhydantoinase A